MNAIESNQAIQDFARERIERATEMQRMAMELAALRNAVEVQQQTIEIYASRDREMCLLMYANGPERTAEEAQKIRAVHQRSKAMLAGEELLLALKAMVVAGNYDEPETQSAIALIDRVEGR